MSLQATIDTDLKEAMKERETEKLAVLRMLKSALTYAAIEKPGADAVLTDAEASAVIRKQVKQRQDAIDDFEKGHRPELAAKEKAELEILNEYLPKQLSEKEIKRIVRESIDEVGATSKAQMGAVMKLAQSKAAGQVDGRTLSQEVQRQLA